MEEKNRPEEYGSDVEMKSPLLTKLDNFWYHYKWHSIVALFLIFTVLICSLQLCSRTEIDIHILYCGNKQISRGSSNGDFPAYTKLTGALADYAEDFSGDGETVVALDDMFYLSPAEIQKWESDGLAVPYSLISEDRSKMNTYLATGEAYICFLSPEVYEIYKEIDGVSRFRTLSEYVPEGKEVEFYNDYAIKLSSTALYGERAIRDNLPADTLVVMRIKSAYGASFGADKENERIERAESVLRSIIGGN